MSSRPRTLAALAAGLCASLAAHAAPTTPTPPPPCPGDFSSDRVVNFTDLNRVLSNFGTLYNFADLNTVLSNFGRTCWAVGAQLSSADVVVVAGQAVAFQATVINQMPSLAQTGNYTIAKSAGPSALFITPANGGWTLNGGQSLVIGAQVFAQIPSDATAPSTVTLNATGQGGAVAAAAARVCVIPTGETNAWVGWGAAGNTTSVGRWNGTLTPANVNFTGRSVTERDPGGGGPDSCWFNGSNFAAFTALTGGTWAVGAANLWGEDNVGWFGTAVTYYRAQMRVPCSTSFPQRMVIDCPAGEERYQTNTLGCGMTATQVSSTRSGTTQNRVWP